MNKDQTNGYNNLINIGTFVIIEQNIDFVHQYLQVSSEHFSNSKVAKGSSSKFLLAYESFYQIIQAILNFRGVRTSDKPGHRITAIQTVCNDLNLTAGQIKMVTDAHNRRNEATYRTPVPPISNTEANSMINLVESLIPKVAIIIGVENISGFE